jgi:carbonic anhydrase
MTFPFIAERVENGTLQLIGAHFKISDGTLSMLDPADQVFKRIGETAA